LWLGEARFRPGLFLGCYFCRRLSIKSLRHRHNRDDTTYPVVASARAPARASAELNPALVEAARALQAERPRLSLRQIAGRLAEQGYVGVSGEPYAATSVRNMLQG